MARLSAADREIVAEWLYREREVLHHAGQADSASGLGFLGIEVLMRPAR
jgi:hypothetical protein